MLVTYITKLMILCKRVQPVTSSLNIREDSQPQNRYACARDNCPI